MNLEDQCLFLVADEEGGSQQNKLDTLVKISVKVESNLRKIMHDFGFN